MNSHRRSLILLALAAPLTGLASAAAPKSDSAKRKVKMVKLHTNFGAITLELDAKAAPITVANFLQYAKDGHYDGTIFHRVIDGFMIQGGGFTADMEQKPTRAEIQNEAQNGLKNVTYSVAMARTPPPVCTDSPVSVRIRAMSAWWTGTPVRAASRSTICTHDAPASRNPRATASGSSEYAVTRS